MLTELTGIVLADEYVESFDAFVQAAGDDPNHWRYIGDFRATRGVEDKLDANVFRAVGMRSAELLAGAVGNKGAWITSHPLTLGLVRMHNGFSQNPEDRIFHVETMPAALEAVGAEMDLLPPWARRD